jgi:hypothetical protein
VLEELAATTDRRRGARIWRLSVKLVATEPELRSVVEVDEDVDVAMVEVEVEEEVVVPAE